MRPLGDVARALLDQASSPSTVRQMCERARVGYAAGAYTATRLLGAGLLVEADDVPLPVRTGPGRPPRVLKAAERPDDDATLAMLQRVFAPRKPVLAEWDAL